MNLKMIIAFVTDEKTDTVLQAARDAGATGATVITSVRGEGLEPEKTFLGLELSAQRDVLMFLVAAPRAREILETISEAGKFDEEPGTGIAVQIEIEDAVGLKTQEETLIQESEESLGVKQNQPPSPTSCPRASSPSRQPPPCAKPSI